MRPIAAAAAFAVLAAPTLAGSDSTSLGVAYICSAEQAPAAAGPQKLTLLPGMGTGGFQASTDAEAQAWFDYGVRLYHAFYHDEAKQAFDRAAELDPACAMCAWGQALAHGSTMNFDVDAAERAKALAFADRAASLAKAAGAKDPGAKDQGLIAALRARYAGDGDEAGYARAMEALAAAHPDDNEIADLTAHALLIRARDGVGGEDEKAVKLLEAALKRAPDDTAAIHYYIHATEFVGRPALALPYAQRLAGLAPDASHLVHMAAHTLFRVGRYEDVALVNANAIAVDARTGAAWGYRRPLGEAFYYGHNFQFGLAGAMMAGDGELAVKYADHAPKAFPDSFPAERRMGITARAYAALGRYAPDRALAIPEPAKDAALLQVMRRYARGEAFAARGDLAALRAERRALAALKPPKGQGGTAALAALAGQVLEGRALMLEGRPAKAAKAFDKAARSQERLFAGAFDPPPWWYPIRRSVAAAQLQAGDAAAAEASAKASLAHWPDDALALRTLAEAERRQGRAEAAAEHLAQARRLWRGELEATPVRMI